MNAENVMGVYKIIFKLTGDLYIGSSKNIRKRQIRHFSNLRCGKHHNIFLQRVWNKYGEENFDFEIIENLEHESDLFVRETFWINALSPTYNLGEVGGGDMISNHPSKDDIIRRIADTLRKNISKLSDEERISKYGQFGSNNPNWRGGISGDDATCCVECGKSISYGHERCLSCCKIGNKNPFYGKKHSDEFIQRRSQSMTGKPYKGNQRKRIQINGVIYESCAEAARVLQVSSALITYRIKKFPSEYLILDDVV